MKQVTIQCLPTSVQRTCWQTKLDLKWKVIVKWLTTIYFSIAVCTYVYRMTVYACMHMPQRRWDPFYCLCLCPLHQWAPQQEFIPRPSDVYHIIMWVHCYINCKAKARSKRDVLKNLTLYCTYPPTMKTNILHVNHAVGSMKYWSLTGSCYLLI